MITRRNAALMASCSGDQPPTGTCQPTPRGLHATRPASCLEPFKGLWPNSKSFTDEHFPVTTMTNSSSYRH